MTSYTWSLGKKYAPTGGICLYYSYGKKFKQHSSINSPIFSVVCFIYLQSWLQRPKAAAREHLLLTSTKHKLLVHVPKTASTFKESFYKMIGQFTSELCASEFLNKNSSNTKNWRFELLWLIFIKSAARHSCRIYGLQFTDSLRNSMSSIPRLLKCGTRMYTRKQQLHHTTS